MLYSPRDVSAQSYVAKQKLGTPLTDGNTVLILSWVCVRADSKQFRAMTTSRIPCGHLSSIYPYTRSHNKNIHTPTSNTHRPMTLSLTIEVLTTQKKLYPWNANIILNRFNVTAWSYINSHSWYVVERMLVIQTIQKMQNTRRKQSTTN